MVAECDAFAGFLCEMYMKNAFRVSILNIVLQASWWAISSTACYLWHSLMMALYKLPRSKHTFTLAFRFFGYVANNTYGVGSIWSGWSSSLSISSLELIGTSLLICHTGSIDASSLIPYFPLRDPKQSKELVQNIWRYSTLVMVLVHGR